MVHEFVSPPRGASSPRLSWIGKTLSAGTAALVLGFSGWVGARMLEGQAPEAPARIAAPAPTEPQAPNAPVQEVAQQPAAAFAQWLDPTPLAGAAPPAFAASAPRIAAFQPLTQPTALASVADPAPEPALQVAALPAPLEAAPVEPAAAPAPPPRPLDLKASAPAPRTLRRGLTRVAKSGAQPAPAQEPSFFEKLFGGGPRESGPALAYAAPQDGLMRAERDLPAIGFSGRYDRQTAVYDISARTVYLPNGTKLEAHSGLGDHMDDPRRVHVRMKGATPPHVYNLRWRESLFHGVRAIRLTPQGGKHAIFGRDGLLAHTYMLGPRGDSNGCVSFRDYNAFMRAFERGEFTKLAVVSSL